MIDVGNTNKRSTKSFLASEKIEYREYQRNIAEKCLNKISLVVLPTGMGKTIIALMLVAKQLKNDNNKILFLAPTKPLVSQHTQFLRKFLTIDKESIVMFTGETSPEKRKQLWSEKRIKCT